MWIGRTPKASAAAMTRKARRGNGTDWNASPRVTPCNISSMARWSTRPRPVIRAKGASPSKPRVRKCSCADSNSGRRAILRNNGIPFRPAVARTSRFARGRINPCHRRLHSRKFSSMAPTKRSLSPANRSWSIRWNAPGMRKADSMWLTCATTRLDPPIPATPGSHASSNSSMMMEMAAWTGR